MDQNSNNHININVQSQESGIEDNIIIDGKTTFSRICPNCKKKMFYKNKYDRNYREKKKSLCPKCSKNTLEYREKNFGKNHPCLGKKRSKETIEKIKKTKSEREYPVYQSQEFKEKISKIVSANHPMKGRSVYSIWLEKYGEEEADRRQAEQIKKISKSSKSWKRKTGPENPLYGRKRPEEVTKRARETLKKTGYAAWKTPEFREKQRQNTLKNPIMKGMNLYDYWVFKHGKEIADEKWANWIINNKNCAKRGENCHFYGKPPPMNTGYGTQGWYKGIFFRSSLELMILIHLIDNNIPYESLERTEYTIPYIFEGEMHNYFGDYLVNGNEWWEIKPKFKQNDPKNLAKKEAAEKFCKERGWVFKYIDPKVKVLIVREKYLKGDIIPQDRCKEQFDKRFGAKRKYSMNKSEIETI